MVKWMTVSSKVDMQVDLDSTFTLKMAAVMFAET
jgi:hypothetical protein